MLWRNKQGYDSGSGRGHVGIFVDLQFGDIGK